jgi:hypothetical protein
MDNIDLPPIVIHITDAIQVGGETVPVIYESRADLPPDMNFIQVGDTSGSNVTYTNNPDVPVLTVPGDSSDSAPTVGPITQEEVEQDKAATEAEQSRQDAILDLITEWKQEVPEQEFQTQLPPLPGSD